MKRLPDEDDVCVWGESLLGAKLGTKLPRLHSERGYAPCWHSLCPQRRQCSSTTSYVVLIAKCCQHGTRVPRSPRQRIGSDGRDLLPKSGGKFRDKLQPEKKTIRKNEIKGT
jgi:hypothetical protein